MEKETISRSLQLYSQATNIPLCLFEAGNQTGKFSHEVQDFNLPLLLFSCMGEEVPDVWYSFTPEYAYFGGVRLDDGAIIFLGPTLLGECTDVQAAALRRRLGRRPQDTASIRQYFTLTGPHNLKSLKAALTLLCRLFGRPEPAPEEIPLLPFTWNLPYPVAPVSEIPDYSDSSNALETQLVACISAGNVREMNRLLSENISSQPAALNLPMDAMRSYILGANMLASRTALAAGISYPIANAMNGQYVEQILKARTVSELSALFFRFFQEYTGRVAELHTLSSDSPVVKFVQQYVTTQYGRKITPHILAEKLNMSCPYLCTHFKKETGMTISAYVQKEKIREAKRLLKGSDYSIVEISEALAFSSQSYFCAVFKKITGMTPESYRSSPSILTLQEVPLPPRG